MKEILNREEIKNKFKEKWNEVIKEYTENESNAFDELNNEEYRLSDIIHIIKNIKSSNVVKE